MSNNSIMGRPKKPFDPKQFEQLCNIFCTKKEIAAIFSICEDTLDTRVREHFDSTFSVVYDEFSVGGIMSLRRVQMKRAIQDGNVQMLIWLGKNKLKQSDKIEQRIEGKLDDKLILDFGSGDE